MTKQHRERGTPQETQKQTKNTVPRFRSTCSTLVETRTSKKKRDQNTSPAGELSNNTEKGTNKRLRSNSDRRVKYTAEGSKTQTHQRETRNAHFVVHMQLAIYHELSRTQPKLEGKCVSVCVDALAVVR